MIEKYLPNKKYYEFSTNCRCGVVVNEATMKKIQKILYKAEAEIKNILHNTEDVKPYSWSLVNIIENDIIKKQKFFYYTEYVPYWSTRERIDEFKLTSPRYLKDFYEIHSNEELEDVKKCLLEELEQEEKE